jgi:hypothetical protein
VNNDRDLKEANNYQILYRKRTEAETLKGELHGGAQKQTATTAATRHRTCRDIKC